MQFHGEEIEGNDEQHAGHDRGDLRRGLLVFRSGTAQHAMDGGHG